MATSAAPAENARAVNRYVANTAHAAIASVKRRMTVVEEPKSRATGMKSKVFSDPRYSMVIRGKSPRRGRSGIPEPGRPLWTPLARAPKAWRSAGAIWMTSSP